MSDCGVCLDGGDWDAPTLYNYNFVKARKEYSCCECGRKIHKGAEYQRVTGLWGGRFETYRTCMDCYYIREAFRCGGGFLFCDLWNTLWEFKNDINTGCLERIKTPSAKAYYLEQLRKMRGIK